MSVSRATAKKAIPVSLVGQVVWWVVWLMLGLALAANRRGRTFIVKPAPTKAPKANIESYSTRSRVAKIIAWGWLLIWGLMIGIVTLQWVFWWNSKPFLPSFASWDQMFENLDFLLEPGIAFLMFFASKWIYPPKLVAKREGLNPLDITLWGVQFFFFATLAVAFLHVPVSVSLFGLLALVSLIVLCLTQTYLGFRKMRIAVIISLTSLLFITACIQNDTFCDYVGDHGLLKLLIAAAFGFLLEGLSREGAGELTAPPQIASL